LVLVRRQTQVVLEVTEATLCLELQLLLVAAVGEEVLIALVVAVVLAVERPLTILQPQLEGHQPKVLLVV
jgi:hypothetical protein